MPFTKYTNTSYEQSHTNDPDNLPIFLIPGINGNGNELRELAEAINKQRKGRTPIYIYEEPIIDGEPLQITLPERASLIAEEMLEIRQFSPLPYILVGYSFGGILAAEVMRQLQNLSYDPRLYVIDQPALSSTQKYFMKDDGKFKADLAKVVNYAAQLSGIKPIVMTEQILSSLNILELEERIDQLASEVLDQRTMSNSQQAAFYIHLEIAKCNIRNLMITNPNPEQKLNNVHVIFTTETALKYSDNKQTSSQFTGEWELVSQNVVHLNPYISSKLSKQSHMDLLKGKTEELPENNAALVAGLITNNLKNEITREFLIGKHIQAIFAKHPKRTSVQFFNPYKPMENSLLSADAQEVMDCDPSQEENIDRINMRMQTTI